MTEFWSQTKNQKDILLGSFHSVSLVFALSVRSWHPWQRGEQHPCVKTTFGSKEEMHAHVLL